jgi:3-oxoacyl-[acyl-carrier protein] reductase
MREIAIVTGGSRGIGKAIALQLARDGFDIWLNFNKNREKAEEVKRGIEEIGQKCELIPFDVSDKNQVNDVLKNKVEKLNGENERISTLVNNAGIIKDNIFLWMQDEEWQKVINTNLNSFFYVTKTVVDHMVENKNGSIINVSSLSGVAGNFGQANYSAAKAGLIAAAKTLSKELGRYKVRVNVVVPGIIETDMIEEIKDAKLFKKMIPLRRFGKSEEVANAVSFLCSPKASYITGAVIPVTGGFYA